MQNREADGCKAGAGDPEKRGLRDALEGKYTAHHALSLWRREVFIVWPGLSSAGLKFKTTLAAVFPVLGYRGAHALGRDNAGR